jgi:hypothetical protein
MEQCLFVVREKTRTILARKLSKRSFLFFFFGGGPRVECVMLHITMFVRGYADFDCQLRV